MKRDYKHAKCLQKNRHFSVHLQPIEPLSSRVRRRFITRGSMLQHFPLFVSSSRGISMAVCQSSFVCVFVML